LSLGIIGIDHVQIAAPRALESECLKFYREVLALPEIEKPDELKPRGGAWFQVGLLQMHVGFLVRDLPAAKIAVQSHGVTIDSEGVAEGLKRFFIRDPAGNRIEIGQR
jgi:catechol 2,3-dioxygenase-like lactoylglutathione lyase family enzyme